MFIETFQSSSFDRLGRRHERQYGRCHCDTCLVEFVRGNCDWSRHINNENTLTFCSSTCSREARKKGGLSDSKLRKINLERYGVEHTLQLETVRESSRETSQLHWGCLHPMQSKELQLKMKHTLSSRYHVVSAFHVHREKWNYDDICRKRLETMKLRGTICSSKPENVMYELLKKVFKDVQRQVRPPKTHWDIDFYVGDIDTWIQVDGIYWHGLNRDIDEIRSSTSPRDQKIARAWETDRKQERWFAEHDMKLIRVTDKETLKMNADNVQSLFAYLQAPTST